MFNATKFVDSNYSNYFHKYDTKSMVNMYLGRKVEKIKEFPKQILKKIIKLFGDFFGWHEWKNNIKKRQKCSKVRGYCLPIRVTSNRDNL